MSWIEFSRELEKCSHCGLCLSVCPTYAISKREQYSPRGRLALMRADGNSIENLETNFVTSCLRCGQCETVCPTGVRYASIIRGYLNQRTDSIVEGMHLARSGPIDSHFEEHVLREMERFYALWVAELRSSWSPQLMSDTGYLLVHPLLDTARGGGEILSAAKERILNAHGAVGYDRVLQALTLPWAENGFRNLLEEICGRVISGRMPKDTSIYAIDQMLPQSLSVNYTCPDVVNTAMLLRYVFDINSFTSPLEATVALDSTIHRSCDLFLSREFLRVPDRLRSATAAPVSDPQATAWLRNQIDAKEQWLTENDVDLLLTNNIYSLHRHKRAVHIYNAMR